MPQDPRPTQSADEAAVWEAFCARLAAAGRTVLEAAPDAPRDPSGDASGDPSGDASGVALDRAEGLRYVARLARGFLKDLVADAQPARLAFVPGDWLKIGLDNPDYAYFGAKLEPGVRYVLRGRMGDAARIGFGVYSGGLGTPAGLVCDDYLDRENDARNARPAAGTAVDGAASSRASATTAPSSAREDAPFEIRIGPDVPKGSGLRTGPATNALNARITLLHRATDRLPELELVREGAVAKPPPLDPAAFLAGLDRVGRTLEGTVAQFLAWTKSFQSHRHEVREIDPALLASAQGDPRTRYFYSYWELAENEAFVVDLEPPPCDYWNLQLGNHWLESFDFMRFETHLNPETAVADEHGRVRVVIARRDPGVPNWLDTAGHARGGLALRWVGAEWIPETRARVVPIETLHSRGDGPETPSSTRTR